MSRRLARAARRRHIRVSQEAAMQTDNPFLDGVARVFTDAAGAAQSLRGEIDTFVRQRLEKLVADMDFVPREEFEAVKAMAAKARTENESLAARIAELEKAAAASK
jgi:hypothetical protein